MRKAEVPILVVAAKGAKKVFEEDKCDPVSAASEEQHASIIEFQHKGSIAIDRASAIVACNHNYVAVACKDGRIAVWNSYECHLSVCVNSTFCCKNLQIF